MQPPHPTPDPGAPPPDHEPKPESMAQFEPPNAGARPLSSLRLWSLSLLAAILAGLGSWYVGEQTYTRLEVTTAGLPQEVLRDRGRLATAMAKLTTISQSTRAAAAYGILGGTLGLGLGLAGGLARKAIGAAVVSGIVGVFLGAAAGAGPPWGLVPRYYESLLAATESEETNDVVRGLIVHAAVWGAVGLAGGLVLGMGAGGWKRTFLGAIGGLMGGLLAAVTFDFVGVASLPNGATGLPVSPAWTTRLMAHGLVALFAAIGATLFALNLRPETPPAQTAA